MTTINAKTVKNEPVEVVLDQALVQSVTSAVRAGSVNEKRFDINLAEGKYAEGTLANLLQNPTIESKRDFIVSRTGNLAVEFMSRTQPSGLSTSTANWWAFSLAGDKYNDEIIILVKKSRLLRCVQGCRTLKGGDKDSGSVGVAEFFLLPVTKLVAKLDGVSE